MLGRQRQIKPIEVLKLYSKYQSCIQNILQRQIYFSYGYRKNGFKTLEKIEQNSFVNVVTDINIAIANSKYQRFIPNIKVIFQIKNPR